MHTTTTIQLLTTTAALASLAACSASNREQRFTTPSQLLATSQPAEPLEEIQIGEQLTLLSSWREWDTYAYAMLALPKPLRLRQQIGQRYDELAGGSKQYPAYTSAPRAQYRASICSGLKELFKSNRDFAICITLDGLLQEVPIEAAEVYASNFANGLVTRLMLDGFLQHWAKMGAKVDPADLDIFVPSNGRVDLSIFSTPNGYDTGNPLSHLDDLLKDNSLQAAGILWGWQAGSSLAGLRGGDQKYRAAVWKLIKTRYSSEQIGTMVGYTLSYVVAYAQTQKARQEAGGGPLAPGDILKKAATDPQIVFGKKLLGRIQELLLLDFYVSSVKSKDPKQVDIYFAFIRGYVKGITQASDAIFDYVFTVAYGIGYSDGFRDGYAKGYRDGWHDGYAAGYKKAWDEANEKIKQLQAALDNSSGGWLDTALDIVGTIGPIVISML
jgi:hypothetical protein